MIKTQFILFTLNGRWKFRIAFCDKQISFKPVYTTKTFRLAVPLWFLQKQKSAVEFGNIVITNLASYEVCLLTK